MHKYVSHDLKIHVKFSIISVWLSCFMLSLSRSASGATYHPRPREGSIVSEFDLRSLDVIISGAAPLPLDVCHTAGKRLGCIIKQGWGMSELSGTGSTNPDDGNREGSSGRPLTSMEFKIIDVDNGSVLPPGIEGEVVCKVPIS